jgi:hypothetical protein
VRCVNQKDEYFAQEDGGTQRNFAQFGFRALSTIFDNRRSFLEAQLNSALTLLTHQGGTMATKKRSSSKKKSSGRKYGKAASKSVKSAMHRKKKGTLKSGKGGKGGTVKSRKQAIAIGLSEAREKGAKVPKKK